MRTRPAALFVREPVQALELVVVLAVRDERTVGGVRVVVLMRREVPGSEEPASPAATRR